MLTTLDNLMKLHDEAAEARHVHGSPLYNAKADEARQALRAAVEGTLLRTSAWNKTTAELNAIYGEMCAINQTPTKLQTAEQRERLTTLRGECVELHYRRINPQPTEGDVCKGHKEVIRQMLAHLEFAKDCNYVAILDPRGLDEAITAAKALLGEK